MNIKDGCIGEMLFLIFIISITLNFWPFLLKTTIIITVLIMLIFLIDYIQTIILLNFNRNTKEVLSFNVDVKEIETEKKYIKNQLKKHYRGEKYYSFLKKSKIFEI